METQDQVWASLQGLRQGDQDYLLYEAKFIDKWNRGGFSSILPEFIKVERFVEGLDPFLRAKVISSSPKSFKSAISIARYKHRKHSHAKIGSERHSYSQTIAPINEYQIVELANPIMIPYLPLPIEHNFVVAHEKEEPVMTNVEEHVCKALKVEARDSVNHEVYEDSPIVCKLENSELEHEEECKISLKSTTKDDEVSMEDSPKLMEQSSQPMDDGDLSKGEARKEEEQRENLKPEKESIVEAGGLIDNHQIIASKENVIQGEVIINLDPACLIEDAQSLKYKQEGLWPHKDEDLAHTNTIMQGLVDKIESACTFTELLCEGNGSEVVSDENIEVALIPRDRQCVNKLSVSDVADLEMGDASSLCYVDDYSKMGDASDVVLLGSTNSDFSGDFAKTWDIVSMEAKHFVNGSLVIECHALYSGWLFWIEASVLRFQVKCHLGAANFVASYPLLLQAHDEKESMVSNETSKDAFEDEEEDDWGFDEPTCMMDTNMQANVDKAMERILSLRLGKLEKHVPKDHEVPNTPQGDASMQNYHGYVTLVDAFYTVNRLWEALQVFQRYLFVLLGDMIGIYNITMVYKIQIHSNILWDSNVRVWDPGKHTCQILKVGDWEAAFVGNSSTKPPIQMQNLGVGKAGKAIELLCNHFMVTSLGLQDVYNYDVSTSNRGFEPIERRFSLLSTVLAENQPFSLGDGT